MRTRVQRLALSTALLTSALLGVAAPSQAAGPAKAAGGQVDGPAYFPTADGVCDGPPADYASFTSYPGLRLEGDLVGCLYTLIEDFRDTPSGMYVETGQEVFVGSLDGGPAGTFTTNYRFQAKFAPDGAELFGRCQHPIVQGSGTGGFAGATGRLDFKDIIEDPITFVYRGHIRLPQRSRG